MSAYALTCTRVWHLFEEYIYVSACLCFGFGLSGFPEHVQPYLLCIVGEEQCGESLAERCSHDMLDIFR